jgi:hypothetical protein
MKLFSNKTKTMTKYAKLLVLKSQAKKGLIHIGRVSTGPICSKRSVKTSSKTGWSRGIPAFGANLK